MEDVLTNNKPVQIYFNVNSALESCGCLIFLLMIFAGSYVVEIFHTICGK